MKRLGEQMAAEYESRLKGLVNDIETKKEDLREIDEHIRELQKKAQNRFIYSVEKNVNGLRAMIHKSESKINVHSKNIENIDFKFSEIFNQINLISDKDFIADCEFVCQDVKGNQLIKTDAIELINSGKELSGINITFYLFDLLYFDGKDLTNSSWNERVQILKKFKYTDNVKQIPFVIVTDRESASKAIEMFSKLSGSEGAVIKRYDGKYDPGTESDAWIKYESGVKEVIDNGKENKDTDISGNDSENNQSN